MLFSSSRVYTSRMNQEEKIQIYIKQVRDEGNKDMERFIGALSEEFQSKLQVVAEGVSGLHAKLDIVAADVEEIKTKLEIKADLSYVAGIDRRVRALESKEK